MAFVVAVVPYDSEWPARFRELAGPIREVLGSVALRIDHVGSTSIPGLAAKPIIDIQISVQDFHLFESYGGPLQSLGYVFRSENPELTKRYFREKPGSERIHVHVRRAGSWAEQFALLFRDFLRAYDEEARKYEELKRELAERFRTDRHAYTDAKQPFIWDLMGRADRWSQEVGWVPGPSDA